MKKEFEGIVGIQRLEKKPEVRRIRMQDPRVLELIQGLKNHIGHLVELNLSDKKACQKIKFALLKAQKRKELPIKKIAQRYRDGWQLYVDMRQHA